MNNWKLNDFGMEFRPLLESEDCTVDISDYEDLWIEFEVDGYGIVGKSIPVEMVKKPLEAHEEYKGE